LLKLRRGALLHDVGKISVPGEVLNKAGSLTDEEFEVVRGHSISGALMVSHAGLPEEAGWVRSHHERVDGRGYPDGLRGDEIPLEARILFVADSFEAMTSDRPYRAGMGTEAALAELEGCAGSQFDAGVVDAFAALVRRADVDGFVEQLSTGLEHTHRARRAGDGRVPGACESAAQRRPRRGHPDSRPSQPEPARQAARDAELDSDREPRDEAQPEPAT